MTALEYIWAILTAPLTAPIRYLFKQRLLRATVARTRKDPLAGCNSSSTQANSKSAETVRRRNMLADFGQFMEEHAGDTFIYDESTVPHSKSALFDAICLELIRDADPKSQDLLRTGIEMLAHFQPGVGDEPLWPHGIDTRRFKLTAGHQELREEARKMLEHAKGQKPRWEKFNNLVEADRSAMASKAANAIEIGRLMSPEIKRALFGPDPAGERQS